jgi:hypothetical protein
MVCQEHTRLCAAVCWCRHTQPLSAPRPSWGATVKRNWARFVEALELTPSFSFTIIFYLSLFHFLPISLLQVRAPLFLGNIVSAFFELHSIFAFSSQFTFSYFMLSRGFNSSLWGVLAVTRAIGVQSQVYAILLTGTVPQRYNVITSPSCVCIGSIHRP